MCVYVCVWVCMRVCVCMWMCLTVSVYVCLYVWLCLYVCASNCVCLCMSVSVCVCVELCMCVCCTQLLSSMFCMSVWSQQFQSADVSQLALLPVPSLPHWNPSRHTAVNGTRSPLASGPVAKPPGLSVEPFLPQIYCHQALCKQTRLPLPAFWELTLDSLNVLQTPSASLWPLPP